MFRATAILSGSSMVSIIMSLITAKVMALYLQPVGYGYYGLLQNFVAIATLAAGVGMASGLVFAGAAAVTENNLRVIAALRRASWMIYWITAALAVLLCAIFRSRLSQWTLGSGSDGTIILLMSVPLLLQVAKNIHMGTLNAYHQVGALAKCALFGSVLVPCASIPLIVVYGARGIVPAIFADGLINCIIYRFFLRKAIGPNPIKPARTEIVHAARTLLKFGGPYTASMLVGTGTQLALPMIALHMLGAESVGYYRAATAISVGYLGFLVTAMGQDYFPRVSAAAGKPSVIVHLINEQHRLVMLIAVPVILGALAVVPFLVPLIYSREFIPSVKILEWQMIGDLFRFAGWTMSCAILAHSGAVKYLLTETISGVASVTCLWIWVRWCGLSGLGIGFLAAYMIYYFAVWLIARGEFPLKWTSYNKKAMLAGVGAAVLIRILPATPVAGLRTPVALALALAFGIPNLRVIVRELSGSHKDAVSAAR